MEYCGSAVISVIRFLRGLLINHDTPPTPQLTRSKPDRPRSWGRRGPVENRLYYIAISATKRYFFMRLTNGKGPLSVAAGANLTLRLGYLLRQQGVVGRQSQLRLGIRA